MSAEFSAMRKMTAAGQMLEALKAVLEDDMKTRARLASSTIVQVCAAIAAAEAPPEPEPEPSMEDLFGDPGPGQYIADLLADAKAHDEAFQPARSMLKLGDEFPEAGMGGAR